MKLRLRNLALMGAMMSLVAAGAEAQEITVMGYGGSFQDNYVKAVIEPFAQAFPDIKVTYYATLSSATALANLRTQRDAPQTDAVIFDLSIAKIARDEGLLTELSVADVPNMVDIANVGRELGGFAVPLTYDTLDLLYNAQVFAEPPTSWEALWDEAHRGKVVISAQGGTDIQAFLLTLIANRLAGEDDYQNNLQPGIDKMIQLAPSVQSWEPSPETYIQVANGTADIAAGWNARAQFYYDQTDGAVRATVPQESTAVQVNVIAAVANGSQAQATQKFINYVLDPQTQARFAHQMYYAPTNMKAVVDEAVKSRIPYMDAAVQANLIPVNWVEAAEMRSQLVEAWKRQIIPASR